MTARFRIGIDLGGTKIEAAAVDRLGVVRVRRRIAAPTGNYRATIEAIAALVGAIEQQIGETVSVGIGMPGTISPITGLVKNANSTWLIGRPLQRDLESTLGRPARLANDANCFALSEATDGAAAGMETVFGVILGTGVGGGIVMGGASSSVPMRSPENGVTIHCPGRGPMRSQGRRAIAVDQAVSRLFFPALALRPTMVIMAGAT